MKIITLRCKNCNGHLNVNDDQTMLFCPYCGQKTLIIESDDVKKVRIKSDTKKSIEFGKQNIELEKIKIKEKDEKRIFWGIVGYFIILFLIVVGMNIGEYFENRKKTVAAPMSSKEAKFVYYEKVEEEFEKAGFENIVIVEDSNVVYNIKYDKGDVIKVTIDGSKWYKAGDKYEPNAHVVITYFG